MALWPRPKNWVEIGTGSRPKNKGPKRALVWCGEEQARAASLIQRCALVLRSICIPVGRNLVRRSTLDHHNHERL